MNIFLNCFIYNYNIIKSYTSINISFIGFIHLQLIIFVLQKNRLVYDERRMMKKIIFLC